MASSWRGMRPGATRTLLGVADALGNVIFPFPTLCDPAFVGIEIGAQIVDVDPNLPGLPIGLSQGMALRMGH